MGKNVEKYHPYDTITYLVSVHDILNLGDPYIVIPAFGIFLVLLSFDRKILEI